MGNPVAQGTVGIAPNGAVFNHAYRHRIPVIGMESVVGKGNILQRQGIALSLRLPSHIDIHQIFGNSQGALYFAFRY